MLFSRPLAGGTAKGLFLCREVWVRNGFDGNSEGCGYFSQVLVGRLAGAGFKATQVAKAHFGTIRESRLIDASEFANDLNRGPIETELEALLGNYIGVSHDSILATFGQYGKSGKKVFTSLAIYRQIWLAFLAKTCQNQGMDISGEALTRARIDMGLERADMADKLGVSLRTVANWEKNGVPSHRVILVRSKIGSQLDAATRDSREPTMVPTATRNALKDFTSDEGGITGEQLALPMSEFVIHLQQEIDGLAEATRVMREAASKVQPPGKYISRNQILGTFSTIELVDEVRKRVAGMEREKPENNPAEDPDYSNMSDQDAKNYGLAAYKGDPNIGLDDIPHEP